MSVETGVQEPTYILTRAWHEKYHISSTGLTFRQLANACELWHQNSLTPIESRIGLISERRYVDIPYIRARGRRKVNDEDKHKQWAWHVLDVPPGQHPGWELWLQQFTKKLKALTGFRVGNMGTYLQRFQDRGEEYQYRALFYIKELSMILDVRADTIRKWADNGVEGYGKLPRSYYDPDQMPMNQKSGEYSTKKFQGIGRLDYFFKTIDIVRFFKGELANPDAKFDTLDDKIGNTESQKQMAADSGYFVYDISKVFPATFQGFIEWATSNVYIQDRVKRKPVRFIPNEKQLELYRNVFIVNQDGAFKHKVIGVSRPRGDYKTFDITILILFRFFNFYKEKIYLVTNSVQQTTHLLFAEAREIIKNSPSLSGTLGLTILSDSINLMTGKGAENTFSFITMISAEGGARSNATCFGWSEAWKHKGGEGDVAEIEQSIRGVDNAWFLVESTVAPKGHWFHRLYKTYVDGEDDILYFQYYDGSERQNPRVDAKYLAHCKTMYPFHYKMFWDNRWEDAATTLFPEPRILEMKTIGIHGGYSRSSEYLQAIQEIATLNKDMLQYGDKLNDSNMKLRRDMLMQSLHYVDAIYELPAKDGDLDKLEDIYNASFVVGIGIDRAQHFNERSDRTVIVTVARALFDESQTQKYGTDRMFFVLDVHVLTEVTFDYMVSYIKSNAEKYAGNVAYVDVEDYNAKDLVDVLRGCFGHQMVEIAPTTLKHQLKIFTELHLASEHGYIKMPMLKVWMDDQSKLHYEAPPPGVPSLIELEMSHFEAHPPTNQRGKKGSAGYFGSPYKKSSRVPIGKANDDTVFALAHAINASIRGDIAASVRRTVLAEAYVNTNVIGNYLNSNYGMAF